MRITYCLLFVFVAVSALAAGMTPESFVLADLETRQATIEGMQTQIELLLQGADEEELISADQENRTKIDLIFEKYGTTGATHAAYGTGARQEILRWLEENPEWQGESETIANQFEELSSQLQLLRGGE